MARTYPRAIRASLSSALPLARLARGLAPLGFTLVSLTVASAPSPTGAQALDPGTWITSGQVNAIAATRRTVFVGGRFTALAPHTGSGVEVGLGGNARIRPSPEVRGEVFVVIPDEHGGWFLGGRFGTVGGVPRPYLAHVLADGRVADWRSAPDGAVRGLQYRNGTLYASGEFLHAGGLPRNGVAAFDASTGEVLAFDPQVENGVVYGIALDGPTLYIGGLFEYVRREPRSNLAAVDAVTAEPTAWAPNPNPTVHSIAVTEGTVYVAGEFTSIGGIARRNLAALDAASGHVTTWSPTVSGALLQIAVDRELLYVWGERGVGTERGLQPAAAIDRRTGAISGWHPLVNGAVRALAVHGQRVILGGTFTQLGDLLRAHVGAVDARTGAPTDWNPVATGPVGALAVDHGVVYVGGSFTGIGGVSRRYLAALDAATGRPLDWNPEPHRPFHPNPLAGGGISSLAIRGSTLYVGGDYDSIAGVPRGFLTAFDVNTRELLPWAPTVATEMDVILPTDSVLYLSRGVVGSPDSGPGAVRIADATTTPWQVRPERRGPRGDLQGAIYGMAAGAGVIYVAGWYGELNDQPHTNLSAVDPATGAVLPWTPSAPDYYQFAVQVVGGSVIVGGDETCSAFDPVTAAPLWSRPGGTYALLPLGPTLYRAGHDVEAIDPATGAPLGWRVQADGDGIGSLATDGRHLYVGGSFSQIAGVERGNFARFTLPATSVAISRALDRHASVIALEPTRLTASSDITHAVATLRFALPEASTVSLAVFDLQGRRVAKLIDRESLAAGPHEVVLRTTEWRAGIYLCRLEAGRRVESRRISVVR